MMQIGIPPRPSEEVKQEIEISKRANMDNIVLKAVETFRGD